MKAYAVVKNVEAFRKAVLISKWDACQLKNGNWLAVFENPATRDVQRAQAAGAIFLPPLEDTDATPPPEFLALIPAEVGLSPSDPPFRAAKKIHAHTGWPPHNPSRW